MDYYDYYYGYITQLIRIAKKHGIVLQNNTNCDCLFSDNLVGLQSACKELAQGGIKPFKREEKIINGETIRKFYFKP